MTTPTADPVPAPRGARDPLLDLWRGVALVDMAWVHLATYPVGMPAPAADWIGHHTRFAAGCFVLLSGMTVRRVFGAGLAAGGERAGAIRRRLARRALLLALVGQLAGVVYTLLEALGPSAAAAGPSAAQRALDVAVFARPGVTGGLLLLYSVLLLATPGLDKLRTRFGGLATMAASLGLFAAATWAGAWAHVPPWSFPIAHWQPLFVAGYLLDPLRDRARDRRGAVALGWRMAAAALVAALFVVRNGPAIGIAVPGLPAFDFTKVPLRPAELAWYFVASAFVLLWTAWAYESSPAARRAASWLLRLGRWSLLVYVAHLLVEPALISWLTLTDPSPWARALCLPVMVACLVAVATGADRFDAWSDGAGRGWRAVRAWTSRVPSAGTVGGLATAATMGFVLSIRLLAETGLPTAAPGTEDQLVGGDPGADVVTADVEAGAAEEFTYDWDGDAFTPDDTASPRLLPAALDDEDPADDDRFEPEDLVIDPDSIATEQ